MWKDDNPYNIKMDDARRNGHLCDPSDFKRKKGNKKREIFHNISYKIPLFQENSNSVFLLVEGLKLQLLQIMLKNVFTI